MADSLKKHESHDAQTRAELGDLKVHVMALTQAVMGILKSAGQRPPPPQAPQMRQAGPPGGPPGAPPGAGAPPGGGLPPQAIAALMAAKRQQAMQGAAPPPSPPMGAMPPGHALGGLQMGLNRLEPTGAFSRGVAHSVNPTKLNFHSPHPGHFAMGGMQPSMPMMGRPPMGAPQMGRPGINPGMLAQMAARYNVR